MTELPPCENGSTLRKQSGPSTESKRRPPLRSLALLMVLLAGGATGVWSVLVSEGAQPGPDIEDLALIPANGQGFLSVRLAELWKTPAAQKGVADAKKRDPK